MFLNLLGTYIVYSYVYMLEEGLYASYIKIYFYISEFHLRYEMPEVVWRSSRLLELNKL